MPALSVLIPARNEIFLKTTIENVLENMRGDTEIIAVLDGYWTNPGIQDHPKVVLVHFTEPVGQRAATNIAARISKAKYIMKLDAHCAVAEGFDVQLIKDMQDDFTMIPRLYNLHAFDWGCPKCGTRAYQGPTPEVCGQCGNTEGIEKVMVWKPRLKRRSDFMRFDRDLVFQYWKEFEKRPEAKPEIAPLMSSLGACWMMRRRRFNQLGMLDEKHGSWGQMGTEIACKTWLSGGTQVVNKRTWYSHMFRTQGGDFGFPYKITGREQEAARKYSRDIWLNNKWPKAIRPFRWIIEKFDPVPEWNLEELAA